MYSLFDHLQLSDSAYFYFRQYVTIKDSLETSQFAQRTALYLGAAATENKISLLRKDKEIDKHQLAFNKKELQKQSLLKNVFGVSLIVLFLFSLLVIRNILLKRKNEKLLAEQVRSTMQRKAMELEMQALRAQMNPHFIFNCLSAIDNLIQTGQSDKATSYLSRFAKLIRGVLESSKNNLVPFQKDFDTMQLYLEMEKFRCNDKFSYDLTTEQILLNGGYKVPSLIVQPFIENAFHHGLLNKKENNRHLDICAKLDKDYIIYTITDNGIGRKKAGIIKEMNSLGENSYGIAITRERNHLHNKHGSSTDVYISDLEQDETVVGTRVVVRIDTFSL